MREFVFFLVTFWTTCIGAGLMAFGTVQVLKTVPYYWAAHLLRYKHLLVFGVAFAFIVLLKMLGSNWPCSVLIPLECFNNVYLDLRQALVAMLVATLTEWTVRL